MEPFKLIKLPHSYNMSNDILKLLCEAYDSYGEYKGYLKTMKFDYKYVLESFLINDIFYSFKIDGSKMDKGMMFYMPYSLKNNESTSFNNLKKSFYYEVTNINQYGISIDIFNKMHKILFEDCKKTSLIKGSGHFRKKQTYILKPGIAGSSISFVPPIHTDINSGIKNLCEYFNSNSDDMLISTAITHFQLERIHPYSTGNGKIGRITIPSQFSLYKKEPPILFLSESLENMKNTYFTLLSTVSDNESDVFIKFFLQCTIEQCNNNIKKIKKINKIYEKDYESFKSTIGGTTVYKIYPIMIKKVVFTTSDIVEESGLHINSVNKVLNKLVDSGFLIKEKRNGTNRVTFQYKNLFEVFVN